MKDESHLPVAEQSLVFRLRKRAEIRRQIKDRKSVQEGARDRIADLLEEAADRIEIIETPKTNVLPNRIFFTGVPGSKWSGVAQILEDNILGFNTSDRSPKKEYLHNSYSGHTGTYFGKGMEYEALLSANHIDHPWKNPHGCKIIKSHEWAYNLDSVKSLFLNDWIMLVYRPDLPSYAWWHEAGGFNITYPSYAAYKDSTTMLSAIMEQNKCILRFAKKHNAKWHHFNKEFVKEYFGTDIPEIESRYEDCLVTIIS
jgi:hypothetical protein